MVKLGTIVGSVENVEEQHETCSGERVVQSMYGIVEKYEVYNTFDLSTTSFL